MPHVTMEYSANLEAKTDMAELCSVVKTVMIDTGLFELGAVRVRALRADHYAIADEMPENAFLAVLLRIGAGRTIDEKKQLGEKLSAALTAFLAPLFQTPHFALSFDIIENDPALSWKKNAIHSRLRSQK